ncbi:MAG: 50S ribosomal protein L13 [Candidatus Magasanikbacteria bacterium]|nr:50S ribosomal protein L13 [Candidatus Magasanikbacteria bacterium]
MNRKKIEFDATNMAPGRLATQIAIVLMGKHKVGYEPRLDKGDKVVVTNLEKIKFTGKKLDQKLYRHHSLHPGGLKEITAKKMMKDNPKKIVLHAVARMLPKNRLRDGRLLRISFK